MFKYQRIVVPLDGSELAERAIAPAVTLAKAMTAEVILLNIVTPLPSKIDPFGRALSREIETAKQYLESVCSQFLLASVGGKIATIVSTEIAQSIISYGEQNKVDLIVMSSQGRSGISRWVFGSVTEEVLRGAPCNTMIICAQVDIESFACKRILVPLDGSSLAERALEPAIAIAESLQAELILLHVIASPSERGETVHSPQSYELKVLADKAVADSYLREVWSGMSNDWVPIKFVTSVGRPPEAIVDYARKHDVDLIVMSSQGRSAISPWVHGSVAEKVLRSAKCATLVIREQESIHKEGLVRMKEI